MKIGILTIHKSPNYGASLQCYALWKFLADNGYETEVIDLYRPLAFADYVPSKRFTRERICKGSLLYRLKRRIRSLFNKKVSFSLYNEKARLKFNEFNSRLCYSKPFHSVDELYQTPPEYDVYIAGSDQLWNPAQPYCIEPYFLTFVRNTKAKKISYATSVGLTDLFDVEKVKFKSWLSSFNSISVREKQAQNLLSSFIDKKVEQVADPTFLLDVNEWLNMAKLPPVSDYILLFTLSPNPVLLEYAYSLSKQAGKNLVVVGQMESESSDNSYIVYNDLGPEEWLGYIAEADFVITDSFHCTDFAIILGSANFYTYIAPSSTRGSRIQDLLSSFGLEKHILDVNLNQTYDDLQKNVICREKVLSCLEKEQEHARQYLLSSLEI